MRAGDTYIIYRRVRGRTEGKMPSVLTLVQRWLSTEPAALLKTILHGRTPPPALMQRHGWWLILLFFVPTVILDVRAIALRKTDEEKEDSERQCNKLRYKLDRIIAAMRSHHVSQQRGTTLDVKEAFEALAVPKLLSYTPAEAGAETIDANEHGTIGMKWELVNESVKKCHRFEKKSNRMVTGLTVLTHVLLQELDEAISKTSDGSEERYLDGEELESNATSLLLVAIQTLSVD